MTEHPAADLNGIDPAGKAIVHGYQLIPAADAAVIGLPYGRDVALLYVTDPDGARWTMLCEPNYAAMLGEAAQSGAFILESTEETPIPCMRRGWPRDWHAWGVEAIDEWAETP